MKGICPECKVRDNDPSEKELNECPLCGRSFCLRHLDPRLAWFSARFKISEIIKDPVYRKLLEKELNLQNGHPCIPYTQRRLEELRLEQRRAIEMFNRLLDSGKRFHFRFPKAIREIEGRCVECGGSLIRDVKTDTVFCSACGLVQEGKVEKARKKTHNKTFEENIEVHTERYHEKEIQSEKTSEPVTVQYVPKKKKRHIPARKILCLIGIFLTLALFMPSLYIVRKYEVVIYRYVFMFIPLDLWINYLVYIPYLFVLSTAHELLHTLALRYYRYHASPFPILIPPILGLTITRHKWLGRKEKISIAFAPLLLSAWCFLYYQYTGSQLAYFYSIVNLSGTLFDIFYAV